MLLPDKVDIKRASLNDDGYGGKTEAWATLKSGYVCRVYPTSSFKALLLTDRGIMTRYSHKLTGNHTDLRAGDRIALNGTEYAVVGVRVFRLGRATAHHIEAELKEVE